MCGKQIYAASGSMGPYQSLVPAQAANTYVFPITGTGPEERSLTLGLYVEAVSADKDGYRAFLVTYDPRIDENVNIPVTSPHRSGYLEVEVDPRIWKNLLPGMIVPLTMYF